MIRLPFPLPLLLLSAALSAGPLAAQQSTSYDDPGDLIRANAAGVLALYGLSALPDTSTGSVVLNTGRAPNRGSDLRASQFGGGFRLREDFPLYFEGYVAYSRYDPMLLLGVAPESEEVSLRWTTLSATGGVGWEFALDPYWSLRPLVHLSLGRVQSDAPGSVAGILGPLDPGLGFLDGGGMTVGGLGGSLALAYRRRWSDSREWDATLRYSYMALEPIGGDADVVASSEASSAALWARYRFPTGHRVWNRPLRGVVDGSASWLIGDQGTAIGTDWLARIGVGAEIDLAETGAPWLSAARLMISYTRGERLDGVSAGIGLSF